MYFRCRVKQYEIMRERQYDLAMGYPTHDVTELKHKLAEGGNVHDLVPEMTWPWKLGYNLVTRSTSDGEAWRTVMMHWYAQQAPQQQTPQWGAPPGYYPPFMNNGMAPDGEQDPDEPPDKRKAIFGFFGNKNGHKPQQEPEQNKKPRRRSRGRKR